MTLSMTEKPTKGSKTNFKDILFKWSEAQGLEVKVKGQWGRARVRPCFPHLSPMEYLSIVDIESKELVLVERMSDLDKCSSEALNRALEESKFMFKIIEILEIKDSFDLRTWRVKTTSGPRQFFTKLSDWPVVLSDNVIYIRDLYEDQYVIDDLNKVIGDGVKMLKALI